MKSYRPTSPFITSKKLNVCSDLDDIVGVLSFSLATTTSRSSVLFTTSFKPTDDVCSCTSTQTDFSLLASNMWRVTIKDVLFPTENRNCECEQGSKWNGMDRYGVRHLFS